MNIQKIESRINDKKKSLEIILNDIATKEKELNDRRGAYSRGLLSNMDKEKKSSSLEVQKRRVVDASTELEGLEGVRTLLQEEITSLERERDLAVLFEGSGKNFNSALATCGDLAGKMSGLAERLTKDMDGFNQMISTLFAATERAISSFSTVHSGVPRNYSLTSFLDGDLEEIETSDHDEILQRAGGEVQGLALTPKIDVDVVSGFLTQVRALRVWQQAVAKYSPDGLLLTRHSLRPSIPKIIPPDGETTRAARILDAKNEIEAERRRERQERKISTFQPKRSGAATVR
ncbi:MAG: hypothetical protein ABIE47_13155 [Pseudomonadota bacterium]